MPGRDRQGIAGEGWERRRLARPITAKGAGPARSPGALPLGGVQPDREGAVIDELDRHHLPESTGRDLDVERP